MVNFINEFIERDINNIGVNPFNVTNKKAGDKKGEFDTANAKNVYFTQYMDYALTTYIWDNLPSELDSRYIEERLFWEGTIVFFRSESGTFYHTPYTSNGVNMYNQPQYIRPYSSYHTMVKLPVPYGWDKYGDKKSQRNYLINNVECVVCWNRPSKLPSYYYSDYFAERIADVEMTGRMAMMWQKSPMVFYGSKKLLSSIKSFFSKIISNEPLIVLDENSRNNAQAIPTKAEFVNDKIRIEKKEYWNEGLTFLGIPNKSVEKKERLVSDEVNIDNASSKQSLEIGLSERLKACDKINKLYGTNISCRINPSVSMYYGTDSVIDDNEFVNKDGDDNEIA